jgi:hypothetical protein
MPTCRSGPEAGCAPWDRREAPRLAQPVSADGAASGQLDGLRVAGRCKLSTIRLTRLVKERRVLPRGRVAPRLLSRRPGAGILRGLVVRDESRFARWRLSIQIAIPVRKGIQDAVGLDRVRSFSTRARHSHWVYSGHIGDGMNPPAVRLGRGSAEDRCDREFPRRSNAQHSRRGF